MAASGFVKVVIQVRARRHEAVDVTMLDQVCHDHAETARTERAGHSHEDRHIVSEHLLPDAMRDAERSSLKRDVLHFFKELISSHVGVDGERPDRHLQEAGALCHS